MSQTPHAIVDNFIEDEELLQNLNNKALWEDLNEKNLCIYYPKDSPVTIWHEVILYVMHSPRLQLPNCKHFEYWCNVLHDGEELNWHVDKNEEEAKKGNLICPKLGLVLYGYPHDVCGGYLEIDSRDKMYSDPDQVFLLRCEGSPYERVEPVYNRIVVFDVSQRHRIAPVLDGTRYGFQLNLW